MRELKAPAFWRRSCIPGAMTHLPIGCMQIIQHLRHYSEPVFQVRQQHTPAGRCCACSGAAAEQCSVGQLVVAASRLLAQWVLVLCRPGRRAAAHIWLSVAFVPEGCCLPTCCTPACCAADLATAPLAAGSPRSATLCASSSWCPCTPSAPSPRSSTRTKPSTGTPCGTGAQLGRAAVGRAARPATA